MKTVIITGASRGIGEATVRYLLTKGVRVVGVGRAKERLEMLGMEKIGGGGVFEFVVGDVGDRETAVKAVELATNGHELIGLVLNAGQANPLGKIADVDVDQFKTCFETNLFGNLHFLQLSLPSLRPTKGRIIMLSTGLASSPFLAMSAYCCSKASLNMMAAVLGLEEPEVTTVAVVPGIVDTEMLGGLIGEEGERVLAKDKVEFLRDWPKLEPWKPAKAVGDLVLLAPYQYSGKCIDWNAPFVAKLN